MSDNAFIDDYTYKDILSYRNEKHTYWLREFYYGFYCRYSRVNKTFYSMWRNDYERMMITMRKIHYG